MRAEEAILSRRSNAFPMLSHCKNRICNTPGSSHRTESTSNLKKPLSCFFLQRFVLQETGCRRSQLLCSHLVLNKLRNNSFSGNNVHQPDVPDTDEKSGDNIRQPRCFIRNDHWSTKTGS